MSNNLDLLIKEIQFKTGLKLEEIAESIGYSRPYISKARKTGSDMLIGKLKEKYKKELGVATADPTDAVVEVLISRVAELLSEKTGRSVVVEIERIHRDAQFLNGEKDGA